MRRILMRTLVVLLVLAGGLFIVATGTLLFGQISGQEFAPDTLERRRYSYYELPVVRIQVTPIWRSVSRPELEQALVDGKYVEISSPPGRWDLIASYRLAQMLREGDAQILSNYLDAWNDAGEVHWLQWTTSHPAIAKILWPEIVKLARQELYFFMPELFELAAERTDAQAFQGDLKQILARKYEELAQVEVELQNSAAAVRFYTEALSYEPHRAASLQGRAQASAALERKQ
jgi:hypothetical protein